MNKNNFLGAFVGTSLIPIIVLNFAAGIIGGIWLIILNQWQFLIYGLIASFIMPFVYSIIISPTLLLAPLIVKLHDKGARISYVFAWFNMFFTHAVILAWIFSIGSIAIGVAETYSQNFWPYLLFGYSIANSPLKYMAKGEGPNAGAGTHSTLYLAQISYLILVIFFIFNISQLALPFILLITLAIEIYQLRSVKSGINIFS